MIFSSVVKLRAIDRTEMCFASFLSGGFITAIGVNPPERKLAKRISVDRSTIQFLTILWVLLAKICY